MQIRLQRKNVMRLARIESHQGPAVIAEYRRQWVRLPFASIREILVQDRLAELAQLLQADDLPRVDREAVTFLPPIDDPRKIICIGLNYRDHALEQGAPIPKEPVVFSKFPTALTGHEQPIRLPTVSHEVDFEAELVAVVGKAGKDLSPEHAAAHVAGYMIGHDVSARDWQKKKDGKQWLLGKSFDTFAPTGPWFVTADEVPDPHALPIRLRLNGQVMQESNTSQLIFSVPYLLHYVSQVFTLEPGDLLFTGTPAGVGFARQPPIFLKRGDVVEVEIEGLGVLRNPVV
jgi:2-keto-4-pentenoate hydratase/2-oxohepta-3-ene-1,7-dioic acid hydratase in catechol pathway